MEPFPGDEIREGEAGVCAEQLGKWQRENPATLMLLPGKPVSVQ